MLSEVEESEFGIVQQSYIIGPVKIKNDDSIKEAPAYCPSERGVGYKNSLFQCFVMFCNVLLCFVTFCNFFCNFWRTDLVWHIIALI